MGIPLREWSEEVFHCIGDCFGRVVVVDDEAQFKSRADVARIQVLVYPNVRMPRSMALDVDGGFDFLCKSLWTMGLG